jgi:hypothetical protein
MIQPAINRTLKKILLVFAVFLSFQAKAEEKANLVINIADCRGGSYNYLSEITILRNGQAFKKIEPQHEKKQVLNDLELGTYTLVYTSLFNKEVNLIVEITSNNEYSIDICTNYIDYSKETYVPVIDRLQENESYSILLSSQGCFHFTHDTIIIKREKQIYTLSWGDKSKQLTVADMDVIRHFEIELNHMTDNGCTTTDTYVVKYEGVQIQKIHDGSCMWNGDYYLKKQLFGIM